MRCPGIFLDFDGVISNNSNELLIRWLHAYACRATGTPIGLQTVRNVAKLATAFSPREMLELFFRAFAIPGEVGDIQRQMHRETSPAVRVSPALQRLVLACEQQGIALKVLSQRSAHSEAIAQFQQMLGLERSYICSTHGISKSNPECFARVAEALGQPLHRWLMVDDSPYALRGAKLAGLMTALVVTPGFSEADYSDYDTLIDLRIGSLEALASLVESGAALLPAA